MNTLLIFKMIAIIAIFLLTIAAGLFPLSLVKTQGRFLALGDAFASGVFLSVAILHMLPDAVSSFQEVLPHVHYPLAYLFCILAFLLMLLLENSFSHTHGDDIHHTHQTTPYVLAFLLSVHSFIEGAALGINTTLASASIIFIAIMAHKGPESFALLMSLQRYLLPTKKIISAILLFSLMTPLGIALATTMIHVLQAHSSKLLEASLNAFAAGTFLYIGVSHTMEKKCQIGGDSSPWSELIALLIGITSMAIVAEWL